ncbi:extracellular tyrosine-protein kinase PKDCC [Gadus chalcogrammus]|uniref:extracellular tyrosine-protein kinase PKDCC n=1 Tax=Gadus chalcogrammus TaxID=1042646 RepID=UPI0024C30FFF|nr:extracellular tyrosine-protein kinase PKDCC [Gadus chalcogrammus]
MPVLGSPLCAAALLAFVVSSVSVSLLIRSLQLGANKGNMTKGTAEDQDLNWRRSALLHQLNERRKEIIPLLSARGSEKKMLAESRYFPQQHQSFSAMFDYNLWNEITDGSRRMLMDEMDCDSLVGVQTGNVLGSGYTKLVLKVVLREDQPVALKFVNEQGNDMEKCLQDFGDPRGCLELVAYKLKKEIVLLQRLKHPNIIKLRGHCMEEPGQGLERDGGGGGGRVTAILEQGYPLQMIQLLQSPWEERFRVCLGLVRLLHFLSRSPLGSVGLLDFQPRQFVLVSGELKLTDLDDASVEETPCRSDRDCLLQFPHRNFTLPCSAAGLCRDLNQKRNLYNAYRYFFTYLLPHQAPPGLTHLVDHIMNSTGELRADINQTLGSFEEILLLYKSGLHLDNLPPSIIRDYTVMRGLATAGDVEYRCWPSFSPRGCVLAVHSALEGMALCSAHPQCTSFSLSGETTWSGHLLASFRSGFSHLLPDGRSEVYLRRAKASEPSGV